MLQSENERFPWLKMSRHHLGLNPTRVEVVHQTKHHILNTLGKVWDKKQGGSDYIMTPEMLFVEI